MIRLAVIIPRIDHLGPVKTVEILVNCLRKYNDMDIRVFYIDKAVGPGVDIKVRVDRLNCRKFRFDEFDIIHTHGIRPDLFALLNRRKIKFHLSTMHNFIFDDLAYTYNKLVSYLFGRIWIRSLKKSDRLICVSRSLEEYYSKWYRKEKLSIIYNGLPEHDELLLPDDEIIRRADAFRARGLKVAGTASILTRRKGINQVLKYISSTEDIGFIVIGEGKGLRDLIRQSDKLGISDLCFFSGFRSHASRYFKSFDVCIFPSWSEGFGLSLLEAVIARIPVVCSDIPVFRELYDQDEVTFFRLGDADSLSESLREALLNGRNKTERAYKKYKGNYTDLFMAQKHYELYNSLCLTWLY